MRIIQGKCIDIHIFITQDTENSVASLLSMERLVLILVCVYYMYGNDFQGQMNTKNVKFSTFCFVRSTPNLADEF